MKQTLWEFLGSPQCKNILMIVFALAALWFVFEFRHQDFSGWGGTIHGSPVYDSPIKIELVR